MALHQTSTAATPATVAHPTDGAPDHLPLPASTVERFASPVAALVIRRLAVCSLHPLAIKAPQESSRTSCFVLPLALETDDDEHLTRGQALGGGGRAYRLNPAPPSLAGRSELLHEVVCDAKGG
jgi:hypothetical protein